MLTVPLTVFTVNCAIDKSFSAPPSPYIYTPGLFLWQVYISHTLHLGLTNKMGVAGTGATSKRQF